MKKLIVVLVLLFGIVSIPDRALCVESLLRRPVILLPLKFNGKTMYESRYIEEYIVRESVMPEGASEQDSLTFVYLVDADGKCTIVSVSDENSVLTPVLRDVVKKMPLAEPAFSVALRNVEFGERIQLNCFNGRIIAKRLMAKSSNEMEKLPPEGTPDCAPLFLGSDVRKFASYCAAHVRFPSGMERIADLNIECLIQFTVGKDGSIEENIRALRTSNTTIFNEAVRVLRYSPKWQPGVQNGHYVRVTYKYPIEFHTR